MHVCILKIKWSRLFVDFVFYFNDSPLRFANASIASIFFVSRHKYTHMRKPFFLERLLFAYSFSRFAILCQRDKRCNVSILRIVAFAITIIIRFCVYWVYLFSRVFLGLISLALVDFDMHILHLNFIWDKTVTIFYLHTIDSVWVLLFYNWIELYLPYRANRCDERNTLLDEISTQMIFQHEYL